MERAVPLLLPPLPPLSPLVLLVLVLLPLPPLPLLLLLSVESSLRIEVYGDPGRGSSVITI